MKRLRELDVVRVVRLSSMHRDFDGTESVMRAPRVGDIGTIVHEYDKKGEAPVVVEMINGDGLTLWLADFERDELQFFRQGVG